MFYILFSILLFIGSVILHVWYCRRSTKTVLHIKAYVWISCIFLCLYVLGVAASNQYVFLPAHSCWGLPFKITAGVIFVLLVPVYLTFYRHTQLISPSQKILLALARRGELSLSELMAVTQKEDFIVTRLNDLCDSRCLRQVQGHYILTPVGNEVVAGLRLMQNILGQDMGG